MLYQESGAAITHVQKHHPLLTVCLLAAMRYLYCTNPVFLDMWATFLFTLPCGTHALFVLNKLQICKYNACFVPRNLVHYHRTFAPCLAERGQRYNIPSNSSDGRGKKRLNSGLNICVTFHMKYICFSHLYKQA